MCYWGAHPTVPWCEAPLAPPLGELLSECEAEGVYYEARKRFKTTHDTLSVSPFGLPALPEGEPRALRASGSPNWRPLQAQKFLAFLFIEPLYCVGCGRLRASPTWRVPNLTAPKIRSAVGAARSRPLARSALALPSRGGMNVRRGCSSTECVTPLSFAAPCNTLSGKPMQLHHSGSPGWRPLPAHQHIPARLMPLPC